MSKVLIVDDSDPTIVYSGSWSVGTTVANNTYEYRNSFHKSSGATPDELSYTFNGTGISVYGTLDTPSSNGLPNVVFAVDDQTPTALNSTGYVTIVSPDIANSHILLYRSPVVAKGQHTLLVKTGTPTNPAAHLYVDFLTVSTGSDSVSGDVIVDDRDISIAYTGNWIPRGNPNEYNGTTRECPDTPNGGSATFSFNGTAITIYGTTDNMGSNSTAQIGFNIDGARIGTFHAPPNAPVIFHTPFFHVEGLSKDKEHTIVMNTLSSNVWFLDYMIYTTEDSAVAGGVEQGSAVGGGAETNLGLIIGCAVAGFVVLTAIVGIIFAMLRWRRMKLKSGANKEAALSEEELFAPIVPFPNPSPSASQNAFEPPVSSHVSPGAGGIITASKYNRASASASTTRLLNSVPDSVYAGIGTSTYSSIPESPHTSNSVYSGQQQESVPPRQSQRFDNNPHSDSTNRRYGSRKGEAGRIRSTYQSRALDGSPSNRDRTKVQSNNEKAQFTHPRKASNVTQATTVPSPPLVAPPSAEEDSGIRIPVMSPPLYTPH